jgi:hypothetical protein
MVVGWMSYKFTGSNNKNGPSSAETLFCPPKVETNRTWFKYYQKKATFYLLKHFITK